MGRFFKNTHKDWIKDLKKIEDKIKWLDRDPDGYMKTNYPDLYPENPDKFYNNTLELLKMIKKTTCNYCSSDLQQDKDHCSLCWTGI